MIAVFICFIICDRPYDNTSLLQGVTTIRMLLLIKIQTHRERRHHHHHHLNNQIRRHYRGRTDP